MGCLKSVIKIFLGLIGFMVVLSLVCYVLNDQSSLKKSSKKYTPAVRSFLNNISKLEESSYLVKETKISNSGIYIFLYSKTWYNPNDTKGVFKDTRLLLKRSEVEDNFIIKFWIEQTLLYVITKSDTSVIIKDYFDEERNLFLTKRKALTELDNPKYEVVAKNKNGHTIFIVTDEISKNRLQKIVDDYIRNNRVPEDGRWMIQFFNKGLRVKEAWSVPYSDTPEYHNRWVYREDVDHGGIAQWTPWNGLEIDKW